VSEKIWNVCEQFDVLASGQFAVASSTKNKILACVKSKFLHVRVELKFAPPFPEFSTLTSTSM
jgi:hypothetical protein